MDVLRTHQITLQPDTPQTRQRTNQLSLTGCSVIDMGGMVVGGVLLGMVSVWMVVGWINVAEPPNQWSGGDRVSGPLSACLAGGDQGVVNALYDPQKRFWGLHRARRGVPASGVQ